MFHTGGYYLENILLKFESYKGCDFTKAAINGKIFAPWPNFGQF